MLKTFQVLPKPIEAILNDSFDPLIVILHGGPHSVSLSSYSKSLAFLSSIGFSLLLVNYRTWMMCWWLSITSLTRGFASCIKNCSSWWFSWRLSDNSLDWPGLAPDKFVVAAVRNPACNLAFNDRYDRHPRLAYGSEGRNNYTEAPSAEHLTLLHSKSPISHVSKVKTPTLFLLGAQDLRVPVSTGLQYARALKEKGVPVKVIVFPQDTHGIERPQSDFESFLNIGVWFKKYLPLSTFLAMDGSKDGPLKEMPLGIDAATEEEYASQSRLLQEFTSMSSVDKAWVFKSDSGTNSLFFSKQCIHTDRYIYISTLHILLLTISTFYMYTRKFVMKMFSLNFYCRIWIPGNVFD
ncbi:hypothetical protein DVH24_013412 [Malus domestica]|uniref:acylaminoacyl-peptidase n=1 Tax=Malus domestica TaxID=3750 RepID=A0A498HGR4_MALDO|nr:hypothetical protein DVH24_013412 [Malus domestica]